MCNPASFVLTKDKVFWSTKSDSHEDIIEEFSLHADGVRGPNIVRVEITPPDEDFSRPLEEWNFRLDQDILPLWAEDSDLLERRTKAALEEWSDKKIIKEGKVSVKEGLFYAYNLATVYADDSATVRAYGSATVEAYNSAIVEAFGSATVEAFGSATVRAFGSATVYANDSATVKAFGSATVEAYNSAIVEAYNSATVKAYDSAIVKAFGSANSATVKAYDSAIVKAFGSATVEAFGSATVEAFGSATVYANDSATVYANDSATVEACTDNAIVIFKARTAPPKPEKNSTVLVQKETTTILKHKDSNATLQLV